MGTSNTTMTLDQEIEKVYRSVPRRSRAPAFPLDDLLEVFRQAKQFGWGEDISSQFKAAFTSFFSEGWVSEKQYFYNQLLKKSRCVESKDSQQQFLRHVKEFTVVVKEPLFALNNTILNEKEEDFLPLFTERTQKHRQIEQCSVILHQTIFLERQTSQIQEKVYELVCFYKHISTSLEQICTRPTMVSTPLKHFISTFLDKIKRKKIRKNRQQVHPILLNPQSQSLREKRNFNNRLLFSQIRVFTEAFSLFIWNYFEFNMFHNTCIEKLVTVETLYGVCLKYVWSQVGWIGQRGYEYEDHLLNVYCESLPSISLGSKSKLIPSFTHLKNQDNPQKYLKKIVVFYKEVTKMCENADQLLQSFEQVVVQIMKEEDARDYGLFRMGKLIEQILKLERWGSEGGEISYAWTSFCITLEILKEKLLALDPTFYKNKNQQKIQQLKTFIASDLQNYENIMVDEGINDTL